MGSQLFRDKDITYKLFATPEKADIKENVDKDDNVEKTLSDLGSHLTDWWQLAKKDFSKLAHTNVANVNNNAANEPTINRVSLSGDKTPEVRQELLDTIKEKFVPVGILDKYQVAGVFVNWWDNIKYDTRLDNSKVEDGVLNLFQDFKTQKNKMK